MIGLECMNGDVLYLSVMVWTHLDNYYKSTTWNKKK